MYAGWGNLVTRSGTLAVTGRNHEMRRLCILIAVVATVLSIRPVVAIPPPKNASKQQATNIKDSIVATIDDVDDVAMLLLWNGKDHVERIGYREWRVAGRDASNTLEINEKLNKGTNYLVFALYNQIYEGFGKRKWSYHFKLTQDLKTVWEKRDFVVDNDAEIKYWIIFRLDVSSSGSVSISTKINDIPKDEMKVLTKLMVELEKALIAKAPKKTARTRDVIDSVLSGH